MTAPSLVLLGYGGSDPRVAQVSHEIRASILQIRPELDISIAFIDHWPPNALAVAGKLARRGVCEVVGRSEERRVGKECIAVCRSRWSPYH